MNRMMLILGGAAALAGCATPTVGAPRAAADPRAGDAPDTLCRIPHAQDVRVLELDAHEALRRHLAIRQPLPKDVRAVAVDLPASLRTQEVP